MQVGESESDVVSVDMVECEVAHAQRIVFRAGMIVHDDLCLSAEASAANANVLFKRCECSGVGICGGPLQKWMLLEHGAIQLEGTDMCLDVKAERKADGSYESW